MIKDWIALLCCLLMVAGLCYSRALLSAGVVLLWLSALHPAVIGDNWRAWKKDPFAMLSLGFFCSYFISGLWSRDYDFWLASIINKLPFILLPFAFTMAPFGKRRFLYLFTIGLILMQLTIIGNSVVQFLLDPEYYIKGYQFSSPLPTTRYNDHIRFSLSLVFSLLLLVYIIGEPREKPISRTFKIAGIGIMALFVVYIHMLAAKTGLVCLYLAAFGLALLKLYGKSRVKALLLALGIAAVPVAAYLLVPTFEAKIDYVFYEIEKSKQDKRFDYTLSDAGRMITYELGGNAIARHPLTGVGAGDIMDEMRMGYRERYPEVSSDQQYGPINQYMFTALCVGIPLSLFLVAMSLAPFFYKGKAGAYLSLTALVLIVSMMVESMLEVQFGVFAYLFFLLLWINIIKKNSPVARS